MNQDFNKENEYYRRALKHPTIGEPGRKYLESRGISEETIEAWEIGYCPVGHPEYKKLKGRVTFPVRCQQGKIVTISGRTIFKGLSGPKYDMYPFSARKILFGLWQNRNDIRKLNRAIVTEGQLDVITAWQNGFRIATSSFGAHGSLDHLANLSRYAKLIDILYDGDAAGLKGVEMIKNIQTLGDLEVRFKTNIFPRGEDLDSWIQKNSADKLYELLDKSEIDSLKLKLQRMGKVK